MVHYAAGILPVTRRDDGTRVYLVGRDVRDSLWSDFGGKAEKSDRFCPLTTATREFHEETYGCVADARALRQRLFPGNCLLLRSRTQNGHPYFMFVVEVPHMPHLRSCFHKVLGFLRSKNLQKLYVEKTDVRWVDWATLHSPAFAKRTVFSATLAAHHDTLARIAAGESWRDLCADLADEFTHLGSARSTPSTVF
jgi:8-oxo-dGTP pyrophosphatase MutT (NUDIX family)